MKISGKEKGFTFLELLVAVGILVFAIAGMFSSFVYAVLLNETTANSVKAANDAQYVLEQVKGTAYGSLGMYTPPALHNLPDETIVIQKSIGWRIAEVTANVKWNERGRQRTFSLTTRVAR